MEAFKGVIWDHTGAAQRKDGIYRYTVVLVGISTEPIPAAALDNATFHALAHDNTTPLTDVLKTLLAYEAPSPLGTANDVIIGLRRYNPKTAKRKA